jgi:hypothetical protein
MFWLTLTCPSCHPATQPQPGGGGDVDSWRLRRRRSRSLASSWTSARLDFRQNSGEKTKNRFAVDGGDQDSEQKIAAIQEMLMS